MAQGQGKGKERSVSTSRSIEGLPLEVLQLLDVCSRIEVRRQAKLRAIGRKVS